ncbi:MAG: hypothetical protein ACK41T_07240 [Pseudobdellovibrio sp.]
MSKKIVVSSVVVCLVLAVVYGFKQFIGNQRPEKIQMTELASKSMQFQWCSENNGTVTWVYEAHKRKFSRLKPQQMRSRFCKIDIMPVSEQAVHGAKWSNVAYGLDSQASVVKLEWDKQLKFFRASGLPFKSQKLSRELLDESK